jgi:hypothetical protein
VTSQLGLGLCAPLRPPAERDGSSDEWYTPQWLLDALPQPLDLDPCADPGRRVPALRHIVGQEGGDGLAEPWQGRVFCNPPYSAGNLPKWIAKCRAEADRGCEVIALVPARVESGYWWDHVWGVARVGLLEDRIAFEDSQTAGTFGSALIVWPHGSFNCWLPAQIAGRRIAWVWPWAVER